jgi:hypothetical protein
LQRTLRDEFTHRDPGMMQKIYSHLNTAMVHLVKNELDNRGIESVIQGEHLVAVAGGGASADAWYELWLVDDARLPEAARVVQEFIEHAESEPLGTGPWTCPHCGEEVDAEFAACWNCSRERPDEAQ